MKFLIRSLYRLLFPVFLLIAGPGFVMKMRRRGGWNESLKERFGIYPGTCNPTRVLLQSVSVGETLIALKIIDQLREWDPDLTVTLAVGTATGRQLAEREAAAGVQVIYAPLDMTWMVQACLDAVKPEVVGFVEGECWPNFTREADKRGVAMVLLSARLSPSSSSTYERFPVVANELFGRLKLIGLPDEESKGWWQRLRLERPLLEVTGNVKFDPSAGAQPQQRPAFAAMLESLAEGQPVVLASSTHPGEEELIAEAMMGQEAFLALAPRHVERADQVAMNLESLGWRVVRRSKYTASKLPKRMGEKHTCLLIDTTGELRDWTAHADLIIIGKSFKAGGGQSPVDALLAGVPCIVGPDMSNFAHLVEALQQVDGLTSADEETLAARLESLLDDFELGKAQAQRASEVLKRHSGATARSAEIVFEMLNRR